MKTKLRSFLRDESGVTAIEYAVPVAFGAISGGEGIFGQVLNKKFSTFANQMTAVGVSRITSGTAK
ncbi:Flp family type IVb pilin [Brenneria populi subsp. brevivirga]|uniref:Flp family type IVb pilin n=1 Tax=Brenneria populi TaxID=1505588 RepID=UPI002E185FD0|nr:Flp family type IVb pilin [Brenneria populi subsp. brevivirga]